MSNTLVTEAVPEEYPSFTTPEQLSSRIITAAAHEASGRIADMVLAAPLRESVALSSAHATVMVKDETMQSSNTFKDRGASNAVSHSAETGETLVVAASAGNHGKGLAKAAAQRDLQSAVFVPETAPAEKRDPIAALGAELMIEGGLIEEALRAAMEFSRQNNGRFVHPYADPLVIAGQATIGLELVEQAPDMTQLVLTAGGGGMVAGVASVVKEHLENVKVTVAQVQGCDAFVHSLRAGRLVQGQRPVDSRYEGIAVGTVHPLTYGIAQRLVDETVLLEPYQVDRTIYMFQQEFGTLLERAGAVGPAAAAFIAGSAESDSRIVTVASGANPPASLAPYIAEQAKHYGWR